MVVMPWKLSFDEVITQDAAVGGAASPFSKKAICPDRALSISATDVISMSPSPRSSPPTRSAISRVFMRSIYTLSFEKSGASLGRVDGGLKKDLDTFDGDPMFAFEAFEYRGGLAVHKIQIS